MEAAWAATRGGSERSDGSRAEREAAHLDWQGPAAPAKLRALAALRVLAGEVGLSLPQLALGFVLSHPAVTTAIVGPHRGPARGLLWPVGTGGPAADDVLDRIDEIVPASLSLNPSDGGFVPRALTGSRLGRR